MKVMAVSLEIAAEVPARGSMADMNAVAADVDALGAELARLAAACGATVLVAPAAPRSRAGKGSTYPSRLDLAPLKACGAVAHQAQGVNPSLLVGSGVPGCGEGAGEDGAER